MNLNSYSKLVPRGYQVWSTRTCRTGLEAPGL